jgi:hypothetical protein
MDSEFLLTVPMFAMLTLAGQRPAGSFGSESALVRGIKVTRGQLL